MKRRHRTQAFTLIEAVMAMAISVFGVMLLWKGVVYLQHVMAEEMRLERMSQVVQLTQEITETVREAHRVLSVGPDHLELETFDYGTMEFLEPGLFQHLKRVRFEFHSDGQNSSVIRDVYASTVAVTPASSIRFLNNVDLITPTTMNPFFFASYLVGASTLGVRVELALHPPYSAERWVPIKDEAYVQAVP